MPVESACFVEMGGSKPGAPKSILESLRECGALARRVHHHFQFPGPPANFAAVLVEFPIAVDLMDWPRDLSAVLVRGEVITSIGVNRKHSRGRCHFTLWHEFFHSICRPGADARGMAVGTSGTSVGSGLPAGGRPAWNRLAFQEVQYVVSAARQLPEVSCRQLAAWITDN